MHTTRCRISGIGDGDRHLRDRIHREWTFWLPYTWDEIWDIGRDIWEESPLSRGSICTRCCSEVPVDTIPEVSGSSLYRVRIVRIARDSRCRCSIWSCKVSCPCCTTYISLGREDIRYVVIDSDCLRWYRCIVSDVIGICTSDGRIHTHVETDILCISCRDRDRICPCKKLIRSCIHPINDNCICESSLEASESCFGCIRITHLRSCRRGCRPCSSTISYTGCSYIETRIYAWSSCSSGRRICTIYLDKSIVVDLRLSIVTDDESDIIGSCSSSDRIHRKTRSPTRVECHFSSLHCGFCSRF